MKKILIAINNMEIGGIQRSLIELLKLIHDRYDITLYCINFRGDYINEIPKDVTIVKGNKYAVVPEYTTKECRDLGVNEYLLHLFIIIWSRLFGRKIPSKLISILSTKMCDYYDVAISYAQPLNDRFCICLTNEFVLYNCKARKKVSFLHGDYQRYGGNTRYSKWLYERFDIIAAVSDSVLKNLLQILPENKGKSIVVNNACDYLSVKKLSTIDSVVYKRTSFVSVSRLGPEKGLSRCIPICRKLIDEGYSFEWHIVGDGQERGNIENAISDYDLKGVIYLEGSQNNPYRFMRNANALILPSYHEAAPMVYFESASLGLWVLTTETLSAKEIVEKNRIGFVCPNNENGIYTMMKSFLQNGEPHRTSFDMRRINETVIEQFRHLI